MAKKIYRIAPCPSYDVECIESWLQDMAREGWVLEKITGFLNVLAFREDIPRDIRYRLEPNTKNDADPPADILEMCREYGWEYVRPFDCFFIFQADSPNAREMNTDTAVHAMALRSTKRQAFLHILYLLIICADSLVSLLDYPFWMLAKHGSLVFFGVLSVEIWALCELVIRSIHIHRLQRKLRNNTPLDHEKPWRKGAAYHRISWGLSLLLWLVLVIHILSGLVQEAKPVDHASEYTGDPPFVTIADLCQGGTYVPPEDDPAFTLPEELREYHESLTAKLNDFVEEKSSLFTPVYMVWRENTRITAPDGGIIQGSLSVTYCEAISPWLAQGFAQDLIQFDQDFSYFRFLQAPDLDADYVAMYSIGADTSTLVIRQGKIVIQAVMDITDDSGESLFEEWTEMQLARMKEAE